MPRAAARGRRRRRGTSGCACRSATSAPSTTRASPGSFRSSREAETGNRRDRLAARQGARRLERHQRPDLHPRPARRLRRLGARHGARGWSYREVLPFFKRSERYEGGESEYHGADGRARRLRPAQRPSVLRGLARGRRRRPAIRATDDFNGARADGLGPLPADAARPLALRRGDRLPRAGACAAEPARCVTGAQVTRVDRRGRPRRRRRVARRRRAAQRARPTAR